MLIMRQGLVPTLPSYPMAHSVVHCKMCLGVRLLTTESVSNEINPPSPYQLPWTLHSLLNWAWPVIIKVSSSNRLGSVYIDSILEEKQFIALVR